MSFSVKDKHYNPSLDDYWYRIDVWNTEMRSWISRQPTRWWCYIEFGDNGQSYVIHEELYTILQLTWGDQ